MAGNTVVVNVEMNDPSGSARKRTSEYKEFNQEASKAAELSRKAAGVRSWADREQCCQVWLPLWNDDSPKWQNL